MFNFLRPTLGLVLCTVLVRAGVMRNTPENIARLLELGPDELAEELSGQFEGDIVLSADQERELLSHNPNALVAMNYRWPGNTIPVMIVEEDFTPEQIGYIKRAMRQLESVTCLKFVPYGKQHKNYVRVIGSGSGCYSQIGFQGGEQILNLQPNNLNTSCFRLATIEHEFIHTLGFYHQQSVRNRDDYVEIIWQNIKPCQKHNFEIHTNSRVTDFDERYDYGSVMHYSRKAFSINGQDTIVPKDPKAIIGQRVRMSKRDISKLNHMYKCLGKE